jgi:hypothetical protein
MTHLPFSKTRFAIFVLNTMIIIVIAPQWEMIRVGDKVAIQSHHGTFLSQVNPSTTTASQKPMPCAMQREQQSRGSRVEPIFRPRDEKEKHRQCLTFEISLVLPWTLKHLWDWMKLASPAGHDD